MRIRTTVTAAAAGTALVLVAPSADAATLTRFDRSAYDAAPVVTAAGYSISAATSGELGGYLTLSVRATDGSMPSQGQCEPAAVHAVLTVAPGEQFTIDTTGDLCSHVVDGSPSVNAYFGDKQTAYTGTAHRRARVVGDGLIASNRSWLGAQGSVGFSVRW